MSAERVIRSSDICWSVERVFGLFPLWLVIIKSLIKCHIYKLSLLLAYMSQSETNAELSASVALPEDDRARQSLQTEGRAHLGSGKACMWCIDKVLACPFMWFATKAFSLCCGLLVACTTVRFNDDSTITTGIVTVSHHVYSRDYMNK